MAAALQEMDAHMDHMTDAELEDFLSFMEHPPGGGGALAAFAAADDASDEAAATAACSGGAGSAHPTSSAGGSEHYHPAVSGAQCSAGGGGGGGGGGCAHRGSAPRSPGSSDGTGGGGGAESSGYATAGGAYPAHMHAVTAAHGGGPFNMVALPSLAEGEVYVPPPAPPAPVPIPGRGNEPAGIVVPGTLQSCHSVASMGSLTMPLEGLALGSCSPATNGALAAEASAPATGPGMPQMLVFHGAGAAAYGVAGHTPYGSVPMAAVGAFGSFVPASALAPCGSAPLGRAPSLASTLDDSSCEGMGGGTLRHSASWPAGGTAGPELAGASAGAGVAPRGRNASKPPSSGRGRAARSGGAGAASGDTTYHRSSSNASLSHSTIEKQRRDRLNGLLDELGAIVPPTDGRADPGRRPKHIILSDAIALLGALQDQLRAGCSEINDLRARVADAETRAMANAAAAARAAHGATAIDMPLRGGEPAGRPGGRGAGGGGRCRAPRLDAHGGSEPGSMELQLQFPTTPSGTPPAGLAAACCYGSDGGSSAIASPVAAAAGASSPLPAARGGASVVIEQEGTRMRVAVACSDRVGLLSDLVEALKGTGASIARAAITTSADGTACDEFELRMTDVAAACGTAAPAAPDPTAVAVAMDAVRAAVLSVMGGQDGSGSLRGKRTRSAALT